MKKLICLLVTVIFILSFTLTGCSSQDDYDEEDIEFFEGTEDEDEGNVESSDTNEKNIVNQLTLQQYELPGIFTMMKPEGWDVYKAGDYNTLAFITRDESEPLRQVFLFSEIGLFYVDQGQKDLEINYQSNGGYPVQWIDMPVVSPYDGKNFFLNFDAIMESQIARNFRGAGNIPKPAGFTDIEIISQEEMEPVIPGAPAVLVRALLTQNGKIAQGMFMVSAVGDGMGHATALMVTGISAPVDEFAASQSDLMEIVKSFTLDEAYVQKGVDVIQENGERLRQISQTISETSDIITKGWAARNKSDDVRIAKKGDQIMDVERVYDPDTDTVYEVKNGFYDYYQTHQNEYTLKNLQPLPDNAYDLWDKAPKINHGLVSP